MGQERWVLVSGGLGAIGFAVAERLARDHASLIIHDHRGYEDMELASRKLIRVGAQEVHCLSFDLSDHQAILLGCESIKAIADVDVVVLCAGVQRTGLIHSLSRSTWDEILSVNLSSAFDFMQAFLPGMAARGFGRFISIASVHGLVASVEKAPYVAAKHGLIGLTKAAALEYANAGSTESGGVTVNAICPGWVDTPLIASQITRLMSEIGVDRVSASDSLIREKMPSRRFVGPNEIAEVVAMLCTSEMKSITGTALPIDGGWSAQ